MKLPEPAEPAQRPSRKTQPHQIALWFAIGVFVIIFFCRRLFFNLTYATWFEVGVGYLASPGIWLARHSGSNQALGMILAMFLGLFSLYFAFYIPLKLWMTSSRHMRIALVLFVAACFATYQIYQWETTKTDWTSRGLNPNRAAFEPQVVVLSGYFDYWYVDSLINQTKSGKGLFEIRMRGHDYYYCRKWHGNDWEPGSWFRVEIANHGEGLSWGLSRSSMGSRGGGGSMAADDESILLGRRLWNKGTFIGANKTDLVTTKYQWRNGNEEFSKLVKVGRWTIPTHIRLTNTYEDRVENYYIKKIEFWPTPGTNWFNQVMEKYAGHNPELRAIDLGEPGVAPERRP